MSGSNTPKLEDVILGQSDKVVTPENEQTIVSKLESVLHLNDAIEYTFKSNMHIFSNLLHCQQSFVMSPLTSTSTLVAMIIASDARDQISQMLFNLDNLTEADEKMMLKAMQFFQSHAVADKKEFLKSSSILYLNTELNLTQQYRDLFKDFVAMDVKTFNNVSEIQEDIQETSEFKFDFSNLSNDTKMLAVGFTRFTPLWANYFSRTQDMKPFYNSNGESVYVHYLYADDFITAGYSEKFSCHVINLPLRWKKTNVTIFLPKEGHEFPMEETECICDEIRQEIDSKAVKLERKTIKLWVPEFSVHTKISMKVLLSSLGMDGLFDEESGRCSRILENSNDAVALDDFYQICIFDAKPNYTPKVRDPSWRADWEEIVCDRPFIYSVTNEISEKKIILCQGVVHELI